MNSDHSLIIICQISPFHRLRFLYRKMSSTEGICPVSTILVFFKSCPGLSSSSTMDVRLFSSGNVLVRLSIFYNWPVQTVYSVLWTNRIWTGISLLGYEHPCRIWYWISVCHPLQQETSRSCPTLSDRPPDWRQGSYWKSRPYACLLQHRTLSLFSKESCICYGTPVSIRLSS